MNCTAESVVISKEISEAQSNNALKVVFDSKQSKVKQHADEISKLKKQIEDLKLAQGATVNESIQMNQFDMRTNCSYRGRRRNYNSSRGGFRGRQSGRFRG